MNAPKRKPLVVTMGDPAGIGPEITAGAWKALRETGPAFAWIGDPACLPPGTPYEDVVTLTEAGSIFSKALPVLPLSLVAPVYPGEPDVLNAGPVVDSILRAVGLTRAEDAGAVVTCPISKAVLRDAGFPYPGHTEFLAALCEVPGEEVMMLASPMLRVVPVTVHVSLRDALNTLTTDLIVKVARTTAHALKRDFGILNPRLAIAGLNPHAGEGGHMGREEIDIIIPAIEQLRARGLNVHGPMPPDTMFTDTARANYDVALCMYHDQALIPIKTLDMENGVNTTLGLPIVRTSPDHGTAFDIAGKNRAKPESLIAALRLAGQLASYRAANPEPPEMRFT
ncbi:4-hydroxythreonine-4-phosphate dehydrogenase PdxA [Acetobacter oeni]|uniref:4-hydroxythreonine-4-phosphate dehydrogenase n=1 Tax=Acetobacter oeni TaxID=304077 RepID=A0A511XP77_9PROT|nr:4-hydroxythreonine-4-phosphate dehydrogenase PdxA [Acetobacter oeni]MBB3882843.1 4-hydroxythreonine-4-phosphate dehydrogenase [Acetobacter oeni]NHO18930.1 4-hydroxythreonine-4-phosphate dehydrogenase PdxA [Acetobacter oeni]GBR03702.1 pyridoxal phosphate biosynthetic protein PdxA [Acetobacter oeni LMG 21952]GEN64763.1 4-hydroxythreonine-4-phosphate dehydrogenase [Acetobacter oeni]